MNSEEMLVLVVVDSVSTTSLVPVTFTVSVSSLLGRRVIGTTSILFAGTSMSDWVIFPIVGNAMVRLYPLPGGRGAIRNSPLASVAAPVLMFRSGLDTDTVAPTIG